MISIIICSANPTLLDNVLVNIKLTIGVIHEILVYENSGKQKGICEVYNQGVRDAKYSMLCFMHEDVEIHTPMWGLSVLKSFKQNARLGLLGIAGSSYKSFSPSGWDSSCMRDKINYTNLIQKYKYSKERSDEALISETHSHLASVAVIDGVWFCSRKEILAKNTFDQKLLKKFHGYDIDISLSVGQNYDIAVTFEVLLTHLSEGNFNKEWIKETLLLHEKWKPRLPVNKANLNIEEMRTCEKLAFKSFINTMRRSKYSAYSCLKVLNSSGIREEFGRSLYVMLYLKCLTA